MGTMLDHLVMGMIAMLLGLALGFVVVLYKAYWGAQGFYEKHLSIDRSGKDYDLRVFNQWMMSLRKDWQRKR